MQPFERTLWFVNPDTTADELLRAVHQANVAVAAGWYAVVKGDSNAPSRETLIAYDEVGDLLYGELAKRRKYEGTSSTQLHPKM